MVRTEFSEETPIHLSFSMIIVPTNTKGYTLVRDTPVLGVEAGHYEVIYDNVIVPYSNLLGERGMGFVIAQVIYFFLSFFLFPFFSFLLSFSFFFSKKNDSIQ